MNIKKVKEYGNEFSRLIAKEKIKLIMIPNVDFTNTDIIESAYKENLVKTLKEVNRLSGELIKYLEEGE